MKILFAGTPDIAVPSLRALNDTHDVVGVLTAPDRVSGRGRRITPPAVKAAATELGLTVLQPERLGADVRSDVASLGAELLVVFAYGRIFGPKFLALFPAGAVNMHPSALPRYRGPSPITAVILAGENETALTVQRVSLEMDAGDIISRKAYPLNGTETTGSLTESVARDAAPELVAAVTAVERGTAAGEPQDHAAATYCRMVAKDDGRIAWSSTAAEIERMVRAYIPWPRARTELDGEALVILESSVFDGNAEGSGIATPLPGTVLGVDTSRGILIQTGDGVLAVSRLQLASRKPLDFRSFLNGVRMDEGTILGEAHES